LGLLNVLTRESLRYGLLLGPILLLAGLVILFFELGRPTRLIRILANLRSSWMSVGGLVQVLFILSGLGYSLPMFVELPWGAEGLGAAMGAAGFITGILVLLYHGFLFGGAKGIPLWNTPILQPLFLFIGCSTGLAILFLIGCGVGVELAGLQTVGNIALVSLIGEGLILWAFLTIPTGRAYELSVAEFKTPRNLGIMGGVAIVLPILLLAAISPTGSAVPGILAGLLILMGGFYVRYLIIMGGRYYPSRIGGA
jgi:formate-dependent nitrite reductase membrane component NrfD